MLTFLADLVESTVGKSGEKTKYSVSGMKRVYVNRDDYRGLICKRCRILYSYTHYISTNSNPEQVLTRPMAGIILSQSVQLEETLDFYGASNNNEWTGLRSCVATLKRFSDILYELIHIKYGIPAYRIEEDNSAFEQSTVEIINYVKNVLLDVSRVFVELCRTLEVASTPLEVFEDEIEEPILPGCLPYDHERREVSDVGKTVTLLATSFLNMIADSSLKAITEGKRPTDKESYALSSIKEEKLRMLEHNFHNMQCNYDTYVSKTDTENQDNMLPVLRGCVSVIFHLCTVSVSLSHYYERHLSAHRDPTRETKKLLVNPQQLLHYLATYCIDNIQKYVNNAKNIHKVTGYGLH